MVFQEDLIAKRIFKKPFLELEQEEMSRVYEEIANNGLESTDRR